ncbi:MAG: oligosaccharide flippase family protein [Clostridia bacterium]|nr:oligosaccharide flippase family protein [Clostridia bacterium]
MPNDLLQLFINSKTGAYNQTKTELIEIKSHAGVLIKGAAAMTLFSLINKLLGVFLRLFLSARIGSEGMGLYQLIMSVYTMFSTFATAGFTVSVSRLIAEKDEKSHADSRLLFNNSFKASFLVSLVATALMLIGADFIAVRFLGDARCALPLRVLALSMPFMALAACLKGWFIAKERVAVTSSASLFEQIVKMSVIALFLNIIMAQTDDIGTLCQGIVYGVTVSEMCSFSYLLLFKILPERRRRDSSAATETRRDSMRSLISVTLPISLSVYLTSILHTAETLLIPYVFESYSGDRADALSQFGMIRGMVVPILFFPFAFLASLVSVFTPEISRLNLLPDRAPLRARISSVMSFVSLLSVAVGGLFFFLNYEIGEAFYPNENTAQAIKILSLVTPFMYVETVSDGLLKAIGEQMQTLKFSVYNSILRVVLILLFVSKTGETGYLWLLVISNSFTYFLCRRRLFKAVKVKPRIKSDIIFPLFCAIFGGVCARFLLARLALSSVTASAFVGTCVYVTAFSLMIMLFSFERTKSLIARLKG